MEDFYSFLRPRTPEPSFDDLLREFSHEQRGDGVVTRRQALLAQQQPDVQQPDVPQLQQQPDVQRQIEHQSSPMEVQPNVEGPISPVTSLDNSDAPYLKDTLVASNDDVEAYCIKSFFRKMKNFA